MGTPSPIKAIVYSVQDLTAAKKIFGAFLGTEPYVDGAYYVGYRVGELEVGLDPNAQARGFAAPISYVDTADIQSSLKALVEAGAQVVQDVTRVAPGLLVARLKDADGNLLGLRQSTGQEGAAPR
jgi:predicted enzyme related to lactoylglutathione lyase